MKNILIGVSVLAVALIGLSFTSPLQNSEVKLGGLFGQTGFVSFAGETSRNGFIMALEDAGKNPADYMIEDDRSDLKTTVIAAQKLINVDKVNVVIGPEWAEFSEVVIPVANESKTLFISPWMVGEGARFESDYYLSATPTERAQVLKVLAHMVAEGQSKIALIYTDNAYAIGLRDMINDELGENYESLQVSYESKVAQDAVDYRTELTKMKASGAQAVYAVMATGMSAQALIKESRELSVSAPIYMPLSAISQLKVEDVAGGQADGVLYATVKEYGRAKEFAAKYKARFGTEPAALSGATTYDMTTLVLKVIDSGAKTPEAVAKYLKEVKNYNGYSNMISFGTDGHVVSGSVELRKVKGDSYSVVN